MKKFHIRADGSIGICRAETQCPIGGTHYFSVGDAINAAEDISGAGFSKFPKSPIKNMPMSDEDRDLEDQIYSKETFGEIEKFDLDERECTVRFPGGSICGEIMPCPTHNRKNTYDLI